VKKEEKNKKNVKKSDYGAEDIYILEGLDPVRKRPGMYIGSTGAGGLHHLVYEVVDNSIDEAMAGYAKNILLELSPDNQVRVNDDGRGIPVEKHKQSGKSALETVMTTLHAGGKFGGESYKVAGGLHGVGVSVVNALSEWLTAEVCRDGEKYIQEYKKGTPTGKVKKQGKCERTGTTITFKPDPEIFTENPHFNFNLIVNHLRQQAYLTKGLRIDILDKRGDKDSSYAFYFEGGLKSYLTYLIGSSNPVHDHPFYIHKEENGIDIEATFSYTDDVESEEHTFANNIYTADGGMHLTGFRSALTRTLNDYARKEGFLKESDSNLTGEDVREGIVAAVSVKLSSPHEPQFEGQTKARLGNPEARSAVETVVNEALSEFLERYSNDAKRILEKNLLAAKARKAAKAAKDTVLRKGALEGLSLPGKLADCISRKPEESELFIVEGDSAGGCFSGDTEVALVDGRSVSFEDLVKEARDNKKNYCYTIKENGGVGVAPIKNPRVTKKNVEVVEVVLDNGEKIKCTPDHLFMLRDGSYKKAEALTRNDSLMPFKEEFFENDDKKMKEAVVNYNHRVIGVRKIHEKMDVYDLEVEKTHNFALSSGVFVHNSAKGGRDKKTQAILPLRGKILNVEKARIDRMLKNKEIRALIIALGTAIGEEFDVSKLRYHKVIIMTDADVDGAHIRTLLLTLFYRYFREIIEQGYLYIAQPPLYQLNKGKKIEYAYNNAEYDKLVKEMGENVNVQRYKGLGEMNPDKLWETTMNPENRVLKRVTIKDAAEADNLFDVLMGEEVAPRKKFIQAHAKGVKNLDI
jgi:DNA gyrase subunit B